MEINEIKKQIKQQLEDSRKKNRINIARYRLISLIQYSEKYDISLNDLLEEYNLLRKTDL